MKSNAKNSPCKFMPLWAVISGLLCYLAYTFHFLNFLIFFAFVPLLSALFKHNKENIHIKGTIFTFSMAFYIPTMLWLYTMCPIPYTELSVPVSAILMTLAILAISAIESVLMVLAFIPYKKLKMCHFSPIIIFSFLFILGEFLQEVLGEFAFPWCKIGTVLSSFTPFVQSASLFGTIFISLLIILINCLLAYTLLSIVKDKSFKKSVLYMSIAIIIFGSNLAFGYIRIGIEKPKTEETATVAVVQGNLGSVKKKDTTLQETFDIYVNLTKKAYSGKDKPDLVLWPETAIPTLFSETKETISAFSKKLNTTIISGVFDKKDDKSFNALAAFYNNGTTSENLYYKRRLAPMGEYIPFYKYFSFMSPKMQNEFLTPGKLPTLLKTDIGNAGCLICYESIFPLIARQSVNNGAEFLVMASNDSWFENSPALEQHYSHAVMRAIENGRYLVRAGNTGISGVVNCFGQTQARIEPNTEDFLVSHIAILKNKTLYTIIGDVIVLPGVGLYLFGIYLFIKKKKEL